MGDLRNTARKQAEQQAIQDAERRRQDGWTIFYFDFDPKRTRRNLSPGDALRHLLKVTSTKIAWWYCPLRGWAIQYTKLPTSTKAYDHGETYRMLHFSNLENEIEAKKILCEDMLLCGIEYYRGLPNKAFDEEVGRLKWLLTASPSVAAKEWLEVRARLHRKTQSVLQTHEAELRAHLLGEIYTGPTGRVALTVRPRLEARNLGASTESDQ